jgi:hypothetical protein
VSALCLQRMGWTMNDHIRILIAARDKEVVDRRDVAIALAAQHQRGHADDLRESIVRIQNAIEAIDRAIADEKQLASVDAPGVNILIKSSGE